jgi:hypothetical protein
MRYQFLDGEMGLSHTMTAFRYNAKEIHTKYGSIIQYAVRSKSQRLISVKTVNSQIVTRTPKARRGARCWKKIVVQDKLRTIWIKKNHRG